MQAEGEQTGVQDEMQAWMLAGVLAEMQAEGYHDGDSMQQVIWLGSRLKAGRPDASR